MTDARTRGPRQGFAVASLTLGILSLLTVYFSIHIRADLLGALGRTRPPAAGCDQQRLPRAIGPASASVSGTVAS
jgi:hypothetical protein